LRELPNAEVEKNVSIIDALVQTGLASSNSDARRAISQGAVSINKVKVEDEELLVQDLLFGEFALISKGKKSLAGLFF
jgi:tyrosyl-tRNA synthetase